MSDTRKLIEQMREALEGMQQWVNMRPDTHPWDAWQRVAPAITAADKWLADAKDVEPKCVVIVDVFGKDWKLEYMSLPVGRHKLYAQEYTYTTPPDTVPASVAREPLTIEKYTALAHRIASKYAHRSDPAYIAYTFPPHTLEQFVRAIEQAHGIQEP